MHPAKRQRVENASATLCKPFRSPLKHLDKPEPYSRTRDDPSKQNSSDTPPNPVRFEVAVPQESVSRVVDSVTSDLDLTTKDDLTKLQKQYSSLARQTRTLNQDLDVVEQALTIQRSSQYDHIQDAVLKWRDIARQAADDVFILSQERINNMGGLKAWQERTGQLSDYRRQNPKRGNSMESAQMDDISHSDADSTEEGDARQSGVDQAEETEEEQTLSIGMMLRFLNIDPDLLGFDDETQSWV